LPSSSVLDLIRRRRAENAPPPHTDNKSLALVVEGGAMRGVISAGMVSALEELGCLSVFDAVYGSSAGAINAAYFLAGQARLGTTIYYEDINNSTFIDLRRIWRRQPILNLDYLTTDVMVRRKVLDISKVLRSPSPFSVIATDVDTERTHVFDRFTDATDLVGALRASATMPVVAGGPYPFRGRRYFDASVVEPIALPTAESCGHTHVLVLLTRNGPMRSKPSALDRYFVGPRLGRVSKTLADRYLHRAQPYAAITRAIEAGVGPLGKAAVLGIRALGPEISRLERRRDVLEAGARRGYDAVVGLLDRHATAK
jgi:predicted patatin/cPLA2 family phospholipase